MVRIRDVTWCAQQLLLLLFFIIITHARDIYCSSSAEMLFSPKFVHLFVC